LAGKTVGFHVTVKAVRRKEKPEVNDEFARDLGDYQNLEELREAVRKAIYGEKEAAEQHTARQQIVDRLVEQHGFPVPDAFIEAQIEGSVQRQLHQLTGRSVDPRALNLDWAAIREKQRPEAERAVRGSLLLEKIADTESIYPTQDEVDREVQRIARQQREPVAAVRMRLEKDGTLARIANSIRTEKTLNFLFEHARKVARPAE
jgi:trigger factor